jgi:hypothetical protein
MTDIGIGKFSNNFVVQQDKTRVIKNFPIDLRSFNKNKNSDIFSLENKNGNALEKLDFLLGNSSYIDPKTSKLNQDAIKSIPGTHWLGFMKSNGNREVAIIIPEGTNMKKPFEVVFYLHGLYYPAYGTGSIHGAIADKNYGFASKVNEIAKNKNIVLVIPQGGAIKTKNEAYKWFNNTDEGGNFYKFKKEVEENIKKISPSIKINKFTIKAHSAGGCAVMNASKNGDLKGIDRIDFLDASYGNWANETYKEYIKDNPNGKLNLIYLENTSTQNGAIELSGQKNVNLIKLKQNQNNTHFTIPKDFISF